MVIATSTTLPGCFSMRLLALLLLPLLSACTSSVTELQALNPPADDFPGALAAEYRAFATSEAEEGHGFAARHYARKGLAALEGKTVEPDALDELLSPKDKAELAEGRAQLVKLLNPAVKNAAPQELARAQLMYDCWQRQLKENVPAEKALCGAEFNTTLTQLIEDVGYDGRIRRFLTFNTGATALTAEHKAVVDDVMCKAADLAGNYWVQLRGYTGRSASQRKLTEARLTNVRRALMKAGMPMEVIRIKKEGSAKAVFLSEDNTMLDTKIITLTVQPNPQELPGGEPK